MAAQLLYATLGIAATALAALRLFSWVAVGFTVGADRPLLLPALRVASALLIGGSLTAFVYAAFAAAGAIMPGLAVDAGIGLVSVALRGAPALRALGATAKELVPQSRQGKSALVVLAALAWIVAIGPPRDADVLHYHLAHVKQILTDGVWRQLPICPYGVPFGSALTFLPFVRIGLPQAAHLLNAGMWAVTCALCVEVVSAADTARRDQLRSIGLVVALGATLMPAMFKGATTAIVDAPMILAVAVAVALLMRVHSIRGFEIGLLGFAAVVGLQSRYQAAAVAMAVTLCGILLIVRGQLSARSVVPFAAGALVAIALASPFYIANAAAFGSPTWPIVTRFGGVADSPAAALAASCTRMELTAFAPTRIVALRRLMFGPIVFPLPLFLAFGLIASVVRRRAATSIAAIYAAAFLVIWAMVQPGMLPRYALYLFPPTFFLIVPIAAELAASRWATIVRITAGVGIGALALLTGLYSRDYIELAIDGDLARFHSATWYWPVLQWANRETPPAARFLLVLEGGQTYYLDRWNRAADVRNSVVVDWRNVRNACDLGRVLRRDRIDYILYSEGASAGRPEGQNIAAALDSARQAGLVTAVRSFDVRLTRQRMLGISTPSRATVFAVDTGETAKGRCR